MIKILTQNGVENTNIDGARDHHFNAGTRNGIVKGVMNEGRLFSAGNNSINLDTCELRVYGHRIVIDEAIYKTIQSLPANPVQYSLVASVTRSENNIAFDLLIQTSSTALTQNDISNGNGIYQIEIGIFTHNPSGAITDITKTADVFCAVSQEDLSNYYTKTEADNKFITPSSLENYNTKMQDDARFVRYDGAQSLTDAQKIQARNNIGVSGNYHIDSYFSLYDFVTTFGNNTWQCIYLTESHPGSYIVTVSKNDNAITFFKIIALQSNYRWSSDAVSELPSNIGYTTISSIIGGNRYRHDYAFESDVTKDNIGLGNVDNTSDMDKPVSTAQAEAIQQGQSVFNVTSVTIYNSYANLPSEYGEANNGAVHICVNTSFTDANIDTASETLARAADWHNGFLATYLYNNGEGTWSKYSVLKSHTIYIDISTGRLYRYTMSGDHIVSIQPYLPTTATAQNKLVTEIDIENLATNTTTDVDYIMGVE